MGLVGWLPDSERLLVTRRVPTDTTREYIETFNVQTGEQRRYGERHSGGQKPFWLETIQKVAFTNLASWQPDSYDLWVSGYGTTQARQPLRRGITLWSVEGRGNVVAFVPQGQRQLLWIDDSGQPVARPPIDLGALGFVLEDGTTVFSMVLSPDGQKLALYNRLGIFIVDVATGTLERAIDDLGDVLDRGKRLAWHARWSSNGRYIAILAMAGQGRGLIMDLLVLDTGTGTLRKIDLGLRLHSLAWALNSRYLVVMGDVRYQEGHTFQGLYLVDAITGQFRRMLPDYETGTGTWGLDWSPDGQSIALECPTWAEGRLCLIPVIVRP
jgi:hypothetical protein